MRDRPINKNAGATTTNQTVYTEPPDEGPPALGESGLAPQSTFFSLTPSSPALSSSHTGFSLVSERDRPSLASLPWPHTFLYCPTCSQPLHQASSSSFLLRVCLHVRRGREASSDPRVRAGSFSWAPRVTSAIHLLSGGCCFYNTRGASGQRQGWLAAETLAWALAPRLATGAAGLLHSHGRQIPSETLSFTPQSSPTRQSSGLS